MSDMLDALSEVQPENGREACLLAAAQAVLQDRNSSYGEPEDNFRFIRRLWNPYIQEKYGVDLELDEIDVALMTALIKIARAGNDPLHLDNYTDGAGYNACAADIAENRIAEQKREAIKVRIDKAAGSNPFSEAVNAIEAMRSMGAQTSE